MKTRRDFYTNSTSIDPLCSQWPDGIATSETKKANSISYHKLHWDYKNLNQKRAESNDGIIDVRIHC